MQVHFFPNAFRFYNFGLIMCLTDSGSIRLWGYGSTMLRMCNSPPSTGKTVPVIQEAEGEKRNMAALAMSAVPLAIAALAYRSRDSPPSPIRVRGICVSGLNPFGASLSMPTVPAMGLASAS